MQQGKINFLVKKKRIFIYSLLVFLCFLLAFLNSCRKEPKNPSWDIDVLAPLVKSSLTISDIIPDSLLQKNPDNSLVLVYNTSLNSFSADSLFKIRDTTLTNKYVAPIQATIGPGGTIVSQTQNINSVSGGVQLTDVTIRSGHMLFSIKSSIKEITHLTYTLPKVTDPISGAMFNKTFIIPKGTTASPGVFTGTFDLSGYKIDLTGSTGTGVNTMQISYIATVDPSAPVPVNIDVGDSVVISNSFIDIVPDYAKGYFGQTLTNEVDTSDVSLFNHIISGTIDLEDIDIGFGIENGIGADARFTINSLNSINTRTGNIVPLSQHPIIGSPINLNRAIDNNGNVTVSTYSVSFNPVNSNIKDFFENLPGKMSYNMDFEINPLGNVSGSNDFIYYDNLLKTNFNMTIPLSVIANDLTLADTMDFKMDASTDNVNHGSLYLYADNGFPFTAQAQLYMMDDNYAIVDSLISTPNSLGAPPLDANFICAGKHLTKLTIPIDENKMDLLRSTKKMYIKIKFNTTAQPKHVKIYSFYKMDVKLVGDFNYTVGK